MQRFAFPMALVALFCLVAPGLRAAPVVRPDAQVIVHLPLSECAALAPERFLAEPGFAPGEGWRLVAPGLGYWRLGVDLSAQSAAGLPLARTEAVVAETLAALDRGAVANVRAALAASGLAGLSLEEGPGERLTVEGQEVVAAVHAGQPSLWQTVAAAGALAGACGVAPESVVLTIAPAAELLWRLSYRSALPEAGASVAQGAALASRMRGALGGGLLVGWHRPAGGAVLIYARGGQRPSLPPDEAMQAPGLHGLVQEARKGAWSHPFQAVVKFFATSSHLAAAVETARGVASRTGNRCQVMVGPERVRHALTPKKAALRKLGLSVEQVEAALNGLSRPLALGGRIEVQPRWEGELGDLALHGQRGRSLPLRKLGKLDTTSAVEPLSFASGRGIVYLTVPTDRTVLVAALVGKLAPVDGLTWTTASWAILPDEETGPILDWWQGKR